MAKEVKKGSKKVAAKKEVATKKVKSVKKKAAPRRVEKKNPNNMINIIYMFLLMLGVSLVFVALTLKISNYIDNSTTLTCLGIALASIIISVFVKKLNE